MTEQNPALVRAYRTIAEKAAQAGQFAVPPAVQNVAAQVAMYCRVDPAGLIVRDYRHGDVRTRGAWSVALEGSDYEWPVRFVQRAVVPGGWVLEPVSGVVVGIYPDR